MSDIIFGLPGTDITTKTRHNFGTPKLDKHLALEGYFGAAKICLREYKLRHITQFSNKENAAEICGVILHTKDRFGENRKHSFTFGSRLQKSFSYQERTTKIHDQEREITRSVTPH